MRFDEARMRQMFFERAQNRVEALDVAHLQDETVKCSQFRKLGSMCSVVGDRFLDQHMFALGEESPCNVVVSIGGRCHRSGVNRRDEIVERFGRCRAEFARNRATPERLHVVYRGELSGRSFRIDPCMIASDMTNPNNANAQLFHWYPKCSQLRKLSRVNARKSSATNDGLQAVMSETNGCRNRCSLDRRDATSLLLRVIGPEPFICPSNPFPQRDRRLPAESAKLGHVQKSSRRAIRLCRVPGEFTIEPDHVTDQFRQLANQNVLAATEVDDLWRVIFLEN